MKKRFLLGFILTALSVSTSVKANKYGVSETENGNFLVTQTRIISPSDLAYQQALAQIQQIFPDDISLINGSIESTTTSVSNVMPPMPDIDIGLPPPPAIPTVGDTESKSYCSGDERISYTLTWKYRDDSNGDGVKDSNPGWVATETMRVTSEECKKHLIDL